MRWIVLRRASPPSARRSISPGPAADPPSRESDFSALQAEDRAFDVVGSIFGVMYATDHRAAVRELARVCARDGVVVISAWTPTSFMPSFGRVVGQFLAPPPPSSAPPGHWGDRDKPEAILAAGALQISCAQVESLPLSFQSREEATSFLIATAGHVVAERTRLLAEGCWSQLAPAVKGVVEEHLRPTPDGIELRFEYLLSRAER